MLMSEGLPLISESLPIDAAARAQLKEIACEVSREEDTAFGRLLPLAAAQARAAADHWDFGAPARVIDERLVGPYAAGNADQLSTRRRLRRVAIARLTLKFFCVDDRLSPAIRSLYPDFFQRLAHFLAGKAQYHYEEDYYAKDVRYALGLTVPSGAHQLDLKARIGAKLILRDLMASRSAQSALAYCASLGWGRWYSNHLDLRAMNEFTPRGWTASFVRMAEMLALNSDVRGVAGVSWFYDPRVADISPHLAYIQTPTRHGAFLARMGSDQHHVANATIRSTVRQNLYKEGKYIPTCYLLAWPRSALIGWAECVKSDPSLSFSNFAPSAGAAPQAYDSESLPVDRVPVVTRVSKVAEMPRSIEERV
jgi:hypothetical protein